MKRAAAYFAAFLIASAAFGTEPGRPAYRFRTLDVPGAVATTAFGIAGNGVVVGVFTDSSNRQHGFRFSKGEFPCRISVTVRLNVSCPTTTSLQICSSRVSLDTNLPGFCTRKSRS